MLNGNIHNASSFQKDPHLFAEWPIVSIGSQKPRLTNPGCNFFATRTIVVTANSAIL